MRGVWFRLERGRLGVLGGFLGGVIVELGVEGG